ncbi:ABC transporter substrate-binding protein [Virgibacillus pantothenticus]|uniref:ABC transporter substrate-binding protein n=1 Tax=Virgibacillus pantothenticus TaxID=1473 RepID=UPI000984826A|nr:ABC transporter substrate-binding protein [Virgibacillus pantothenticus]
MRLISSLVVSLTTAALLVGCSDISSPKENMVELELFSNKAENIATYESMIERFEEQHPNIRINLYAPPDAETLLRTRLVKNDMPDMLAIAGNALYRELVSVDMLVNYEGEPMLDPIQPAYLQTISDLEGSEKKGIHGVPFAANANTMIYNKTKLKELGEDVPKTWDEFIQLLQKAKAVGEIPIYFTFQDSWTTMPAWNSLAGNLQPKQFAEKKTNKEVTFQGTHQEVAEKLLQLKDYGHDRMFGIGYNDGNREFSQGKGVFYSQGNWAIPELLKLNPELDLGVFAMPVTNDPTKNKLVSGIDVLFATLKESKHPEEAKQFISFMMEEQQQQQYMEEQSAFSVRKDVISDDPIMEGIQDNFAEGKISSFPDHFYPAGMGAQNMIQEFLYQGNISKLLKDLDREWDQIQLRY